MQTWEIDPVTGDYIMDGGKPVQTDSLRMAAYFRLKVRRAKWLYAPSTTYGSDLDLYKKRQANLDITAVENTAIKAVQPIVDDGRAAEIRVDFSESARGGIGIKCKILNASGIVEELNLQGVG